MKAKELITKAKVQLILTEPFFATMCLKMAFIEDNTCTTAYTDGVRIGYNAVFVESLKLPEIVGLLIHEICHVVYLHHLRRKGRNPKKWNEAADYAINQILLDGGHKLPKGALINEAYRGLITEQIFGKFNSQDQENKGNNDNGNGAGKGNNGSSNDKPEKQPQPGEVRDFPGNSESERRQHESELKQQIAQAAQVAKRQGKLSASLSRLIDEVLQPVVNWKELLQIFLTEKAREDYSFRKPNPRYIQTGFYLPSLESEKIGDIALIVDTSGSIDRKLLNEFSAEVKEISDSMNANINVLYVDTKVQGQQYFEAGDEMKLEPKGGGGTDFRPGFEALKETGQAAIIYFTDGHCNSYPSYEPDSPVLWAVYNNNSFKPPFGEVIKVK